MFDGSWDLPRWAEALVFTTTLVLLPLLLAVLVKFGDILLPKISRFFKNRGIDIAEPRKLGMLRLVAVLFSIAFSLSFMNSQLADAPDQFASGIILVVASPILFAGIILLAIPFGEKDRSVRTVMVAIYILVILFILQYFFKTLS